MYELSLRFVLRIVCCIACITCEVVQSDARVTLRVLPLEVLVTVLVGQAYWQVLHTVESGSSFGLEFGVY